MPKNAQIFLIVHMVHFIVYYAYIRASSALGGVRNNLCMLSPT